MTGDTVLLLALVRLCVEEQHCWLWLWSQKKPSWLRLDWLVVSAREEQKKEALCMVLLWKHSPQNVPTQTQACTCICSQISACCDTLKSVNKSLNCSCAISTVLRCPSWCRNSVLFLFYHLHFSVTTVLVCAAPDPRSLCWVLCKHVCRACPLPTVQMKMTCIEHVLMLKSTGDFMSFILALDHLVYLTFGDWRCTALLWGHATSRCQRSFPWCSLQTFS